MNLNESLNNKTKLKYNAIVVTNNESNENNEPTEINRSIDDNDENETNINEYPRSNIIKDYLKKKIIIIDNIKNLKENETLRKVIEDMEEKIELLLSAHNIGHGVYKIYDRLKRKFYWENMLKNVEILVKTSH